MTVDVATALARLPVTRLIHFTGALNLPGIFRDGLIRTSRDLRADDQQHYTPTDSERWDGHLDHVCCSIEYPNAYYQAKAKVKPDLINYPDWVCLVLDPQLLLRDGTLFYPCNAAKDSGTWQAEGAAGLVRMWDSPSVPGGFKRKATHHPAVPTDLQAEVQIPGAIPLSAVSAIVAYSQERCRELFGSLYPHNLHPEQVEWRSAPLFFEPQPLTSALHSGAVVPESVWTPSKEDLA